MKIRLILLASLLSVTGIAYGDATILNTDRGSFQNPALPAAALTPNFKVGQAPSGGERYQMRAFNSGIFLNPPELGAPIEADRSYHSFDLSGLNGTITSATLRIWADQGAYDSTASSETAELFDVSTSESVLSNPDSDLTAAAAVFDDLGTGSSYGVFVTTAADDGSYIDVTLNAAALLDLNSAVGSGAWTVGGALQTIDGTYNPGFISERVLKNDNSTPSEPRAQLLLVGTVASNGDRDSDGVTDGVDNCPGVANAEQANNDGTEGGDVCDTDDDNDGVEDTVDNCRKIANPGQADANGDGCGDACVSGGGCFGPICTNN